MNFFRFFLPALLSCSCALLLPAQPERWQQRVSYRMDIDFDVQTHHFHGRQNLIYVNNSPDTLRKVYYHLYFNAFQPGSMMDVRSRTVPDPDPRVADRIQHLGPEETGYHKIGSLLQNGVPVGYEVAETVLEVTLNEPILPNSSAVFDMEFESQVPLQVRRSGRDNAEGIAYSMAQWYPKMAEYDYQGWHANPYVSREFYGVWGDFAVNISIDRNYVIGATGYLQNPDEIGHGYTEKPVRTAARPEKLTWRFVAPNVHDFVWAADPDYTHTSLKRADGTVLHFFFQKNERTEDAWARLPPIMDRAFDFINRAYGQYPFRQYSFIQAGDGGMEYPMATLITGERSLPSLVGVSVHELLHSWYQMVLGTNESLHAWMDEGFTSYASSEVMNFLRREGLLPGQAVDNPHLGTLAGYLNFAQSGLEEPLSIHADHFRTNAAYSVAAYVKGAVFLVQLQYILGEEQFDRAMLDYFRRWKFRHPNPNDFIRVMENASGLELDWYKEYMVYTTRTIDYGIDTVEEVENGRTKITLARLGEMPMPVDLLVTYTDGTTELITIPLVIMRGHKPADKRYAASAFTVAKDWPWTHPGYELELEPGRIPRQIQIDPSGRMADTNLDNNQYNRP